MTTVPVAVAAATGLTRRPPPTMANVISRRSWMANNATALAREAAILNCSFVVYTYV